MCYAPHLLLAMTCEMSLNSFFFFFLAAQQLDKHHPPPFHSPIISWGISTPILVEI